MNDDETSIIPLSNFTKGQAKKIHALTRIFKYTAQKKRKKKKKKKRTFKTAFVKSHFSHWFLMFFSRNIEHHINRIHETALKLIYNDTLNVSFDELLVKDKSVSLHQSNLQQLATEIFRVKNGIIPESWN